MRSFAIAQTQIGLKLVSVIWNSGMECPLFRGFECIEVCGDMIWTFRNVHYIARVRHLGVSVKRGVPLYNCLLDVDIGTN